MEEQITFFDVLRTILLWFSPVIFLEGLLLLFMKVDKHIKLENHLEKEVVRIGKRVFPRIETNIYTFQNWMLKKTFGLGIFFIVYSVLIFLALKN
ncbi:MAG: hypothetical protein PHE18_01705 [Candidatus Omnitrophica bacterium]|nr:hypothetical protein [Candidatus Omnitrophota bacterium]MDD5552569.1 hypothetical protein [Candidatus Omnitrophota bacterium]